MASPSSSCCRTLSLLSMFFVDATEAAPYDRNNKMKKKKTNQRETLTNKNVYHRFSLLIFSRKRKKVEKNQMKISQGLSLRKTQRRSLTKEITKMIFRERIQFEMSWVTTECPSNVQCCPAINANQSISRWFRRTVECEMTWMSAIHFRKASVCASIFSSFHLWHVIVRSCYFQMCKTENVHLAIQPAVDRAEAWHSMCEAFERISLEMTITANFPSAFLFEPFSKLHFVKLFSFEVDFVREKWGGKPEYKFSLFFENVAK